MTNSPHLFADRIINIALTGPLLRLELGTLEPQTGGGQTPQLRSSQTLVMPLDGFLASYGMLQAMVKKLVEDGVIKLQPQDTAAQTSAS